MYMSLCEEAEEGVVGGSRESKVDRVRQGGEAKPQEPERVQETQSSHKGLSLGEVDMA